MLVRARFAASSTNVYGYKHRWINSSEQHKIPYLPRKIVCVAKNFRGRGEVGSYEPSETMIFSKTVDSLIDLAEPIILAGSQDMHYETELVLLMGRSLPINRLGHDSLECVRSVIGLGIALDLTLKDVQNSLKLRGAPWELAKAFDRSCPMSGFIKAPANWWEKDRTVSLTIDGNIVQSQSTSEMIMAPGELISFITKSISLSEGDLILTGTPILPFPTQSLKPGQSLTASITGVGQFTTTVID